MNKYGKLSAHIISESVLMLFAQNSQNQSMLQYGKVCAFFNETQYSLLMPSSIRRFDGT